MLLSHVTTTLYHTPCVLTSTLLTSFVEIHFIVQYAVSVGSKHTLLSVFFLLSI